MYVIVYGGKVSEIDKFCPETWCVVGNCFSLQKEPDTAIRFFQRALQIDPTYTYANTLCGHEQVLKCFISFHTCVHILIIMFGEYGDDVLVCHFAAPIKSLTLVSTPSLLLHYVAFLYR